MVPYREFVAPAPAVIVCRATYPARVVADCVGMALFVAFVVGVFGSLRLGITLHCVRGDVETCVITTHRVLFSTKQVVPIAGDHPASTMAMRRRPEGRTGESYYSVTLATSAGTDVELPLMNQPNAEWFQHFLYDRSERLFVHREGSDGGIDRFVVILFMLYFVLMGTLTVLRAMRWAELSIDETRRMVTVRRHPWFKTHVEEVTLATLGLARVVEVRGAKTSYSLVIDRVDQTVLQVMDLSNQNYLKGIAERINEHLSGGHRAVSR